MKITVEISDSDLKEICRVTGEKKKGPAIRKLVGDALMLKRRERLAQKFIDGEWSAELKGAEESRAADRKDALEETLERVMATLVDANMWIDFTRPRSPRTLKQFLAPFVLDPETHLADPIAFEVLRHATPAESKNIVRQFQMLPLLATPGSVWSDAADLGQQCRQKGITVNSIDLLIAAIAIHHGAEVVTFDDDFRKIATVSKLQVKLLKRPV